MKRKFDFDYGRLPYYIIITLIVSGVLALNYLYFYDHISSNSETINTYSSQRENPQNIRTTSVAGLFYPAETQQLSGAVDTYLSETGNPPHSQHPYIIVVPHAGYQYSAQVAAHAYQRLIPFAKDIKRVILLGPSHFAPVNGAALSEADFFKTPLGLVKINKKLNEKLAQNPLFHYQKNAHAKEHSLEVQLPFLQKVLTKFTIVPVVYGDVEPEKLAEALSPFVNKENTLLVVSSDLSHYLDYETAQNLDEKTVEQVNQKQALEAHQACGATGINTALLLAKKYNYQPRLLDKTNSGNTGGGKESVVGYASWIFDKKDDSRKILSPLEQETENLSDFAQHHGKELLLIAEKSLQTSVTEQKKFTPSRNDFANALFDKGASFVTLKKNGTLRGCIGSLTPKQAISFDVAANTYAAAMEDERFTPVVPEELPDIDISVSLLTGYEQIKYKNEDDLLSQLHAGIDGLVIRDGDRQGLFLPSVWQELPDKQDFLKNLKLKAGLSPTYWSNNIKAYRFRVVEIKKGDKKSEN